MRTASVKICAAMLLLTVFGPAHAAAPVCSEACLNGYVDQYLAALVARDPVKLRLAEKVTFTENTRHLRLGDGLWGTVTGLGSYKHYFADAETGQVGLFATIEENGTPGMFALRLKVENLQISEIETLVVRPQAMRLLKTDATRVKSIWLETLAPEERRPRAEMIAAVDLYFEGLRKGDGNMVPFDDSCNRVENGVQTTNVPRGSGPPMFPSHPGLNLPSMGCREQFNTRMVTYIQEVNPRRYLIVNEERGLVFGVFMFRHPGTITSVNVPKVGTVPMMSAATYPFDVEVAELFKLRNGRIVEIEAVMVSLPYRSDTGWDQ